MMKPEDESEGVELAVGRVITSPDMTLDLDKGIFNYLCEEKRFLSGVL